MEIYFILIVSPFEFFESPLILMNFEASREWKEMLNK